MPETLGNSSLLSLVSYASFPEFWSPSKQNNLLVLSVTDLSISIPLLMLLAQPGTLFSTWNPLPCLSFFPKIHPVSRFFLQCSPSGGSEKPGHHQINGSCQGYKSCGLSEKGQAPSGWDLGWDIRLLRFPVSAKTSLAQRISFSVWGLRRPDSFRCLKATTLLFS